MKTIYGRNHIYALRRNRGLGQKQLAHLLGYRSTAMISRFEHGLSAPPLKVVLLLEIVLGARVDEIYIDLYERMEKVLLCRVDRLPRVLGRRLRERITGREGA
jgi:transcriptional regulator with XRE-family HTH domain